MSPQHLESVGSSSQPILSTLYDISIFGITFPISFFWKLCVVLVKCLFSVEDLFTCIGKMRSSSSDDSFRFSTWNQLPGDQRMTYWQKKKENFEELEGVNWLRKIGKLVGDWIDAILNNVLQSVILVLGPGEEFHRDNVSCCLAYSVAFIQVIVEPVFIVK